MKKQSCPYLGMQGDPTTALDFPSEGNFCHRAEPTAQVNKIHQQRYCLTAGHYGCPVYRAAKPEAMPEALLPPATPQTQVAGMVKQLGTFVLPLIALGVVALGLVLWIVMPKLLGTDNALIPSTGEGTPNGDSSFNLFSFGDARDTTLTPFFPQFGEDPGEMRVPNCPQPSGWMPYITNPTDSLFRLSIVYGVTVEELQRVNCMDEPDTVILPGQVIYVPSVSHGTAPSSILGREPTAFPTFTPAAIVRGPQPTAGSSRDDDSPSNPPPAPTSTVHIPPTSTPRPNVTATKPLIPTTVVPPTATVVLPTNPPPPTRTPRPTATRRPTSTNPPPPTATDRPTATKPPPTPTNPPLPTNTPVPPTATNPPPPTNTPVPPTPTDPPQPTATDPPPPEITEPPPEVTDPPPEETNPPPVEGS